MKTPFTWDLSVPITITKCETTAVGGTRFELEQNGIPMNDITLEGIVVGDAVGQAGFDDVRNRIEAAALECIAAGLEATR